MYNYNIDEILGHFFYESPEEVEGIKSWLAEIEEEKRQELGVSNCRYCGGESYISSVAGFVTQYCVICYKCGARGPVDIYEEKAKKAWNTMKHKADGD